MSFPTIPASFSSAVARVVVDDARGLANRLGERPERDAPAVGEAAAAEDVRLALDRAGELGHEARLADARVGEQRHEPARAIRPRPPELALEERQLALTSDQGEGELAGLPLGPDRHEPVGRHALGLALELEGLDRLDLDRIADEAVRQLPDQDLHLARGLLEPRRDVDRVAGHEVLAGRPGDHLAGVHAGPGGEARAPFALELLVQGDERALHLVGRPHGAERVVLVDDAGGRRRP